MTQSHEIPVIHRREPTVIFDNDLQNDHGPERPGVAPGPRVLQVRGVGKESLQRESKILKRWRTRPGPSVYDKWIALQLSCRGRSDRRHRYQRLLIVVCDRPPVLCRCMRDHNESVDLARSQCRQIPNFQTWQLRRSRLRRRSVADHAFSSTSEWLGFETFGRMYELRGAFKVRSRIHTLTPRLLSRQIDHEQPKLLLRGNS